MSSGKPVKIAILTDARDSVRGFDKAGAAAKETGARFDSVAESSDQVASKGAQAAGALSGLGDLIGGKFGAAMQTGGIAMQAAADSGDLLNVITESAIIRKIKDTAVTVAQTTATVAKTVADKAAAGAAKVWAAAQWALNAAMSANPIGLVVVAILALVAVVAVVISKNENLRAKLIAAWEAIQAATARVWGFIKNLITGVVSAIVAAVRFYLNTAKAIVTGVWSAVRDGTRAAWDGIKSAVRNAVGAVADTLRGIRDKVTGIFDKARSWLLNAGKAIIGGLLDGIENMIGKLKDKLGSITGMIPKLKGPPAKDARLLKPAGQLLIEGLIKGIDDRLPNLRRTLGDVTDTVAGLQPSLDANLAVDARAAFSAGTSRSGSVAPIQITVTGAMDPTAVAQQIVKLLVDLARRLGVPVAQLLGGRA